MYIGKKSTVRNPTIDHLTVDNQRVTSDDNIALEFNNYFVNIGKSLRYNSQRHFPGRGKKHMKYLKKNIKTAFFKPITPKEIIDIVDDFKSNTSSSYDEVDISVVKQVIHMLCHPLCNIFNSSLSKAIFHEKLKIAKVIPVFKNGSSDILNNYRPISVLPVFSKILDFFFNNRLLLFLNQCDIISNSQYGFRAGHSTSCVD